MVDSSPLCYSWQHTAVCCDWAGDWLYIRLALSWYIYGWSGLSKKKGSYHFSVPYAMFNKLSKQGLNTDRMPGNKETKLGIFSACNTILHAADWGKSWAVRLNSPSSLTVQLSTRKWRLIKLHSGSCFCTTHILTQRKKTEAVKEGQEGKRKTKNRNIYKAKCKQYTMRLKDRFTQDIFPH